MIDQEQEEIICTHDEIKFGFKDDAIEYYRCTKCNQGFWKFRDTKQSNLEDFF
jgi:hypothetical protein